MAGESSASASLRQSAGGLPLIWCTECKEKKVLMRTSQKEWSRGQVFYCCPNYKRDGSGCPFWFWEEDYYKLLMDKKLVNVVAGADGRTDPRGEAAAVLDAMLEPMNKGREMLTVAKELVAVLKAICFVCVCMLFVMVLNVFVQLMK